MIQALQTLSSAGNLSAEQIQQIQRQLEMNSRPAPAAERKPAARIATPRRDFTSPVNHTTRNDKSRSPETSPVRNGGGSPVRSLLLEEFRNNKNRKYELRVKENLSRILKEALLNSAAISMARDLSSKSSNLAQLMRRRLYLKKSRGKLWL